MGGIPTIKDGWFMTLLYPHFHGFRNAVLGAFDQTTQRQGTRPISVSMARTMLAWDPVTDPA